MAVWLLWPGGRSSAAQLTSDHVLFLRGIVRGVAANDYERVWPALHPAQQRVATRKIYVRCERLTPVSGHLDWIRVVGTVDRRIAVAGAGTGLVPSKAVTFRVKLTDRALRSSVVVTQTAHAVAVDGRWRWILSPERFATYRSGACPSAGPPPPTA